MKTVKKLVEQATWEAHGSDWFPEDKENLQAKVELAINEAIEQCAKIVEDEVISRQDAEEVAALIRALKSQ